MTRNRRVAAIIDCLIILLICVVPVLICYWLINLDDFICSYLYMLFVSISILLKDLLFRNASIGKKIKRIEVRKKDGTQPSILILILRNITLSISLLGFLEVFLILIDKNRIGDYIFDTKIVETDTNNL